MSMSANPGFSTRGLDASISSNEIVKVDSCVKAASTLRPIRVGILGLGFGLGYFRDYIGVDSERVDIRAVCDIDSHRLEQGKQAFGCPGYSELDLMLRDPDVDVVALFCGPNGRSGLIDRCVDAGKHVMTTKPLEVDPGAIRSTLERASAMGRYVFLNSPSPVLGQDIQLIRRWQESHKLGELIFARTDCWYQRMESSDGSWYDDPGMCPVAPIFRLGIYGLNDILALNRNVVDIQVAATRMKTGRPTPDVAQMTLTLANGAIASFRATWRSRPQRDLLTGEFVFENGVVQRTYCGLDHWDGDPIKLNLRCEDGQGAIIEIEEKVPHNRTNCAYRWDLLQQLIAGREVAGLISLEQAVAAVKVLAQLKERFSQAGVELSASL